MKFINLTPHNIRIQKEDGRIWTLPPSGHEVRIEETFMTAGRIDGIAIHWAQMGSIQDLPPPQEETLYVTSKLVAQRAARRDVYSPGPLIRDEQGQSIACQGLQRHA